MTDAGEVTELRSEGPSIGGRLWIKAAALALIATVVLSDWDWESVVAIAVGAAGWAIAHFLLRDGKAEGW